MGMADTILAFKESLNKCLVDVAKKVLTGSSFTIDHFAATGP